MTLASEKLKIPFSTIQHHSTSLSSVSDKLLLKSWTSRSFSTASCSWAFFLDVLFLFRKLEVIGSEDTIKRWNTSVLVSILKSDSKIRCRYFYIMLLLTNRFYYFEHFRARISRNRLMSLFLVSWGSSDIAPIGTFAFAMMSDPCMSSLWTNGGIVYQGNKLRYSFAVSKLYSLNART